MPKWIYFLLAICLYSYPLAAQHEITFQVDMRISMRCKRFEPARGDTLLIRGNFNRWQGNRHFMEDVDGDSVFKAFFAFNDLPGLNIQYKFVIHKTSGWDIWENNPDPENPDNGNRRFIHSEQPVVLPIAAFDLDKYLIDIEYKYTVSALREDFLQLRDSIEALHPALYAFTDREIFGQLFDRQLADLKTPMSGDEFYRFIAPLVSRIGCGHSSIRFPEIWWAAQPDRFAPFLLHFTGEKVYIRTFLGNAGTVAAGSELLAINDRSVSNIVNYFYTVIPADGYNRGYQRAILNQRFPYLYAQFYGFPEKFKIRYRSPGLGVIEEISLDPISVKELNRSTITKPALQFEIREDPRVAILRTGNFGFYTPEKETYFYGYIDSVFRVIRQQDIKNLIIDVRGNDGGNPFCAAHIISYIAEDPIPYFDKPIGKYSRLADPVPLTADRFDGELIVLIDENGFSTTGHFCALLKYHDIGTLIGSETGGTYTCNDAKKTIPLRNTGLNLQIARGTFAVAVRGMDRARGVIPDLKVSQSIEDLINGRDTVLEYAIELLR